MCDTVDWLGRSIRPVLFWGSSENSKTLEWSADEQGTRVELGPAGPFNTIIWCWCVSGSDRNRRRHVGNVLHITLPGWAIELMRRGFGDLTCPQCLSLHLANMVQRNTKYSSHQRSYVIGLRMVLISVRTFRCYSKQKEKIINILCCICNE